MNTCGRLRFRCLPHPPLKGLVRWDFGTHYSRRGRFREENAFNRIKNGDIFPEISATNNSILPYLKKTVELSKDGQLASTGIILQWHHNSLFTFTLHNYRNPSQRRCRRHWREAQGSSFLSELWNLNEPFSGLSADFGSYLGKYVSVFDAVKSIFFSETRGWGYRPKFWTQLLPPPLDHLSQPPWSWNDHWIHLEHDFWIGAEHILIFAILAYLLKNNISPIYDVFTYVAKDLDLSQCLNAIDRFSALEHIPLIAFHRFLKFISPQRGVRESFRGLILGKFKGFTYAA